MLRLDQQETTVVAQRYRGFPEAAHGGYASGLLAGGLGSRMVEVTLRKPVPIQLPLILKRVAEGRVELRAGETLLAEASSTTAIRVEAAEPVSLAEAQSATARYPGLSHHPCPECFCCGPKRDDGLRIFPGPVIGRRLVAASWTPDPTEASGDGVLPDHLVWAAFDCPQLWALILHSPRNTREKVVTGSLAAKLEHPVYTGEPHVVMAWPVGREGRRMVADAAVIGPNGELCATCRQTAVITTWGIPLGLDRWNTSRL